MTNTQIIILAAGHGKRMKNGELPKVLVLLQGRPMIQYVLDAIKEADINTDPIIVIGQKANEVKAAVGSSYRFVLQKEQLGTGHAVACAEKILKDNAKNTMVLYGDMPFISANTIQQLSKKHIETNATLSMATIMVPDFESWHNGFYDFSRIIRNENGEIVRTVESKDATADELTIKEVNPVYLCIDNEWLWNNISALQNNNAQKEYYLTDLIKTACDQKETIASIQIDPQEGIGINSPEQLRLAERILETS